MKLKYSKTQVPYIELDKSNKIVFSPTTANKDGYKWVMFSGVTTTTETISSGKGKKKTKKKVNVTQPISVLIDMEFSKVPSGVKNTSNYLTKRYLNSIKKMFDPYVVNGVFLYENIGKFANHINKENDVNQEDLLEDDPMGYYEDEEDDE
jgi:hypothetical protein